MNDTPETPRLQRVEIVDCQSMTDEQIMEKLHEVTELQEASGEEDVLHLMLTCPATATLEDVEEGKQKLTITLEAISDEELNQLQEGLLAMTEYYTNLGIVLIRNRTTTLEEASRILNQGS
jgi:hypothetical protein